MRIAPLLLLTACSPKSEPNSTSHTGQLNDTAEPEGPLTHQFSMAVVADPHVVGPGEHADRLNAAVDWIEANATERDIQLVVILGDICWNDGFTIAHDALNRLTLPWVPVMGDNVIQTDGEATFHSTFLNQIERLSTELNDFEMAPTPVYNPERDQESWLQNMAFSMHGVRFISADWSSRERHPLWGETPDLHNFEGGTWPWLTDQLESVDRAKDNNLILLSHMPLFEGPGGLVTEEAEQAVELLSTHQDAIWANLAGHLHVDTSMEWERAGIEVHVTDATWDDINRIRIVNVDANEHRFEFTHWVEEVD